MHLESLKRNWTELGASDPLWAILTDPSKTGNRWNEDDFFATGVAQVNEMMVRIACMCPRAGKRRALDFGCGVGRLTQPLGAHFEEVIGVDISSSMVERARSYNRWGDRCRYVVNDTHDLRIFPDGHFDFICSYIVLQHMQPRYAREYIAEFVRVLAPGGVLLFQLTDTLLILRSPLRRLVRDVGHFAYTRLYLPLFEPRKAYFEMYGIPKAEVLQLLARCGGRILEVDPDGSAGPCWSSYKYWLTKPDEAVPAK